MTDTTICVENLGLGGIPLGGIPLGGPGKPPSARGSRNPVPEVHNS